MQTRTNSNQSGHCFTSVSKFQKCEYGFTFVGATFFGFSLLDAQLHGPDAKASHMEGMDMHAIFKDGISVSFIR